MQCKGQSEQKKEYPKIYRSIYQPSINESFVNANLNRQTYIKNPSMNSRATTVQPKFGNFFGKINTVRDIFESGLSISHNEPCLGVRFSSDEPYSWMTYNEVDNKIRAFGSALKYHIPKSTANFIGIYGRNSPEWLITHHACGAYGYQVVPLYATLGEEAMQHILKQTEMACIVCHSTKEALHVLSNFESAVKIVIVASYDDSVETVASSYRNRVKVFLFSEFLRDGTNNPVDKHSPSPEDLFMVCYTSGSTGIPKGVMISHEQVVSVIEGLVESSEGKLCCSRTVHMSYLPLAHIFENILSSIAIMYGARIGFLTSSVEGLLADCKSLQPTVLVAVPRVLSRIYEQYHKKIPKSALFMRMYKHALATNLANQKRGKFGNQSPLDRLCFQKLRDSLGGKICVVISGGAPLLPHVLDFTRAVFGLVVEGYGSTETTSSISTTMVGEFRTGVVGAVIYGGEVKLVDVPDLDIVVNRDNRGEICVKGKYCTKGYFKDPERTREVFDEDGWLHTGDIGEFDEKGSLKIVDRCKSILKLAQGEYLAPEKIECIYSTVELIANIYVDGIPRYNFPVAVVVPQFPVLRTRLNSLDSGAYKSLSDNELCENPKVIEFVLETMNTSVNEKLKGFEKVKAIHLTSETFTIDNNLLTPTLKLARQTARRKFADIIQSLYNAI